MHVPASRRHTAPGLLDAGSMMRPPLPRVLRTCVRSSARSVDGFGLLELLLVIAIIAVLAAIAIPHYASMRSEAFNSKVESAVRHVATGEEAYYTVHQHYTSQVTDLDGMVLGDVSISIEGGTSGDLSTSFRVLGSGAGATHTYMWLSDPVPGAPHLIEN
jgi:prepilin-type N-terminal cleavage/methylation domain-containing protein